MVFGGKKEVAVGWWWWLGSLPKEEESLKTAGL